MITFTEISFRLAKCLFDSLKLHNCVLLFINMKYDYGCVIQAEWNQISCFKNRHKRYSKT